MRQGPNLYGHRHRRHRRQSNSATGLLEDRLVLVHHHGIEAGAEGGYSRLAVAPS
jgi:hypothetical protein